MVQSITGQIEAYLKRLLGSQDFVELQRSELAEAFRCVPSQINYVLSTRFTPSQGYLVESRRGGGGYLKIIKLSWEDFQECSALSFGTESQALLNLHEGQGMLRRLLEERWLTPREYQLLRALISREALIGDRQDQDHQRALLLQTAVTALCRMDSQGKDE